MTTTGIGHVSTGRVFRWQYVIIFNGNFLAAARHLILRPGQGETIGRNLVTLTYVTFGDLEFAIAYFAKSPH